MKFYSVLFLVVCIVYVCALDSNQDVVREKRTLDIILKALAESLGYDVAKRPPPMPFPKPAAAPRSGVNPPLAPAAPAPKVPPTPPKMPPPPPPPMPAPKAPAPAPMAPAPAPMAPAPAPRAPAPKVPAPAPAAPKDPAPPMTMAPLQPKNQVALVPRPKPTVPPLLTETVQKMFNINFNWNRNLQPSIAPVPKAPAPAPPMAPKAPAPAPVPKAPAPVPKAPAPAPAPKAPVPAPKTPAGPKSTAAPGKIVYYDYDDPQNGPYLVSLRDYDGYYNYENDNAQQQEEQPQEEQPQQEEKQEEQPQEEEQNQNAENGEQNEQKEQSDDEQDAREKQIDNYRESVQNFWSNSPWNNNNYEKFNAESSVPEYYKSDLQNPNFGKHDFFINHPSGSSYARMEHKKAKPIKTNQESATYQIPTDYYIQSNEPQQGKNSQINKEYNYEGPTFDQYYYVLDNEPKQPPQSASHKIEINNNGEKGIKEPLKLENQYQASVPIPLHVINQENPFVQWVSIEQAGSENTPKKVPLKMQSQKVIKNTQRGKQVGTPLFEFNYQPDHYEADFSGHTIPPPTQQDYSKYNPVPFKLEDELSDKAMIQEQQYGRKYTTVHTDNTDHRAY